MKTFVVGAQENHLHEMVLLSTQNMFEQKDEIFVYNFMFKILLYLDLCLLCHNYMFLFLLPLYCANPD